MPAPVLAASQATMLAAGCLAAGVLLTLIGAWQRRVVLRLRAEGRRTVARATESVLHHAEVGGPATHLVWRFRTEDGHEVEHEGLVDGLHHPSPNETARIIYDPADPHNARLETFAEGTLAWALFFFSGIALLAVAAIALLVELI